MSGSWDQSSRKLIDEIKTTLRLHFKHLKTFPLEARLWGPSVTEIPVLSSEIYGGQFFLQNVETQELPMAVACDILPMPMHFAFSLISMPSLPQASVVAQIPILEEQTTAQAIPMLSTLQIKILEVLSPVIQAIQSHTLPQASFMISKTRKTFELQNSRFQMPIILMSPILKAKLFRLSQRQLAFPIIKTPIPPHRFSQEKRQQFREILAKKFRIPQQDIKLIHAYDRLFLSLYQSLSPQKDGTLECIPKFPVNAQAPMVSAYLVLAQSLKNPEQQFQALVPMKDDQE